MRVCRKLSVTAALAIGMALLAVASVSATPFGRAEIGNEFTARENTGTLLIDVRYRRGRRAAAGFAAGVLLGSAFASQPSYYRGHPSYPYYSPAYPAYGPYSAADPAAAYCMRRFRSYDPATGMYVGFDGYRHPCP
jgi:BA14K-like protein